MPPGFSQVAWEAPTDGAAGGVARINGKRTAPAIPPTDGERLMLFRRRGDQQAFAEVVRSHAPLVWGVCWQILRHRQDAEDAFQATFMILARKAASIRAADSAGGWLYRVAWRTAQSVRTARLRRAAEPLLDDPPQDRSESDQLAAIARREESAALLEELHSLPAKWRDPLVLCCLEGLSRREAASQLGLSVATVKGRLERATRALRTRLAARGAALSAAMAVTTLELSAAQASLPVALPAATVSSSFAFAGFAKTVSTATSPPAAAAPSVVALAQKGLLTMKIAIAAKSAAAVVALLGLSGALSLAAEDGRSSDAAPAKAVLIAEAVETTAAEIVEPAATTIAAPTIAPYAEPRPADVLVPAPATAGNAAPTAATQIQPPSLRDVKLPSVPGMKPVWETHMVDGRPARVLQWVSDPTATTEAGGADAVVRTSAGQSLAWTQAEPVFERRALPPDVLFRQANPLAFADESNDEQSLSLELDYWDAKIEGARRRAEAAESRNDEETEMLIKSAEASDAKAEVLKCKIERRRVELSLERLKAPKPREMSPAEPAAATTPAYGQPSKPRTMVMEVELAEHARLQEEAKARDLGELAKLKAAISSLEAENQRLRALHEPAQR